MPPKRYTKCFFYRSDGTPRTHKRGKGCPHGVKCDFSHPADVTWIKAIAVVCPQDIVDYDNRFGVFPRSPSPRRRSRSRSPARERGRQEQSVEGKQYRSPDKSRRVSESGRWARRSPSRSRSDSRTRRSRERSRSASHRDSRADHDSPRDSNTHTPNIPQRNTVVRDSALNVQSSTAFSPAHSAAQTTAASVPPTPIESAPHTPALPTPASVIAHTPTMAPRTLDPRLRAKAPAALRNIVTPTTSAEPSGSAPPTAAPPTSVPQTPMPPPSMPPPLPPSITADSRPSSTSDLRRPTIITDVEMTEVSPRNSVRPTPTSATIPTLPAKFKFSMTSQPPPSPPLAKARQPSGSLPPTAPPGWMNAIERITRSSKIKKEIIELDEQERTLTRLKDSLSSREYPSKAVTVRATADKTLKETTEKLISIRSKRKMLEQELATSFAEMGYAGMTVRDGRLRGTIQPATGKSMSTPLPEVIKSVSKRVDEQNAMMQDLQARQQAVQEKLAALKMDDNMMDVHEDGSTSHGSARARAEQLNNHLEALQTRMEQQEAQTRDAKHHLQRTQQQMEQTIEARLDGLANRRVPRQMDPATQSVINALTARLEAVTANMEEYEADMAQALTSSEEHKSQITELREQIEEARRDARARKKKADEYSGKMEAWEAALEGILEDQTVVPDMSDSAVADLVDECMRGIIDHYQAECRTALEDAQRTAAQNQNKLQELLAAAQALNRRPQAGPPPQRR